jgi:hypothetical protein
MTLNQCRPRLQEKTDCSTMLLIGVGRRCGCWSHVSVLDAVSASTLLCQGGRLHDRATGRVAGALVAGLSHDIAAGWIARPLLVGLGHNVAAGRVAGSLAVGLSGRHVDWLVGCLFVESSWNDKSQKWVLSECCVCEVVELMLQKRTVKEETSRTLYS